MSIFGGYYTNSILKAEHREMVNALNSNSTAIQYIPSILEEDRKIMYETYVKALQMVKRYNDANGHIINETMTEVSLSEAIVAYYERHHDFITFNSVIGKGAYNVVFDIDTKTLHNCILRACCIDNKNIVDMYLESMKIMLDPAQRFLPKVFDGSFNLEHNTENLLSEKAIKWEIVQKYEKVPAQMILDNVFEYAHTMINILNYSHSKDCKYFDWKYVNFGFDAQNKCLVLLDIDFVHSIHDIESGSEFTSHSTDDWNIGTEYLSTLQYLMLKDELSAKIYDRCILIHEFMCVYEVSKEVKEMVTKPSDDEIYSEYHSKILNDISLDTMFDTALKYAEGNAIITEFITLTQSMVNQKKMELIKIHEEEEKMLEEKRKIQ